MKKKIIALAVITSLTLATGATANWKRSGGGYGDCNQRQVQYQQLDQETRDKIKQFFKDNQELRKEITMKRAEKRALMRSDNPSPQVAAKVAGELFDLRAQMKEKAEVAGLEQYIGAGRRGGSMGPGGRGPGGRHNRAQSSDGQTQ